MAAKKKKQSQKQYMNPLYWMPASLLKEKYDDLTPRNNLPPSSAYGYKSSTPGPKKRFRNKTPQKRK